MRGVWTALITPFDSSGAIDWAAYRRILQDQRAAQVSGVIPCGTTGESPTLTLAEKRQLIETALSELQGSAVRVIAGTGSNSTAETLELSRWAAGRGVAGVLIVTPYYNKPSQTGLQSHFLAVADAVSCEVILYNVPGRTGVSLTAETITQLASHPRIRTLKEATGNVAFTSEILDSLSVAGRQMDILSGDDATYLPLLSVGAAGVVSVASNLFPRAMVQIQEHMDRQELQAAQMIHRRFYPLFRDLFIESNPGPIKEAMAHAGFCESLVRAPLVALSPESRKKLHESMVRCGARKGVRL